MLTCYQRTTSGTASADCEWSVYYDHARDGIGLYSARHQCNLATTFRSIPCSELTQSNDTVLRVLDLKLEASCTIDASRSSSTLFLIETTAARELHKAQKKTRPNTDTSKILRQAVEYFLARRRLAHFRRFHGHLQQDSVGTNIYELEGTSRSLEFSKPDIVMCSLYLALVILAGFARRQLANRTHRSLQSGLWRDLRLGGAFVLCHFFGYYVIGIRMLYSSRVAGLISSYCLAGNWF